jgi:predicted O-methyltransferase YrrM
VPISLLTQRGRWNTSAEEALVLRLLVGGPRPKSIFEIGTFDGASTALMAESAGPDCTVYTLDLPPEILATKGWGFGPDLIGRQFRGSKLEGRVAQLFGESTTFNFEPYRGKMDLAFVDAAHDFVHGYPDSLNALSLVRPGGFVLWHDFSPLWP